MPRFAGCSEHYPGFRYPAPECELKRGQPEGPASQALRAVRGTKHHIRAGTITLEVDPATANVVKAKRYSADKLFADKLFAAFCGKWETKYRHINASFAAWAEDARTASRAAGPSDPTCRSPISRTCSPQSSKPLTRIPVLHSGTLVCPVRCALILMTRTAEMLCDISPHDRREARGYRCLTVRDQP
jgi:hypothetical protein